SASSLLAHGLVQLPPDALLHSQVLHEQLPGAQANDGVATAKTAPLAGLLQGLPKPNAPRPILRRIRLRQIPANGFQKRRTIGAELQQLHRSAADVDADRALPPVERPRDHEALDLNHQRRSVRVL